MRWLATLAFSLLLLTVAYPTAANASPKNRRTTLTFDGPVEIPGMVLAPGTYVFKLLDSSSDRNIVQIFNKDETKLFATVLAVNDYRLKPTGRTVIKFEERSAGSPEAIKEWFYPGDLYGQEFVYPEGRAMQLAKETRQNVQSMSEETATNIVKPAKTPQEPSVVALRSAPVKPMPPPMTTQTPRETARAMPPARPAPSTMAPEPMAQIAQSSSEQASLPQTGSTLPVILLAGLLLLGLGFGFREIARRMN
ncbi:MAG: LPXTG cell wall anchor domain-containing protein [Bryobacteraceae bacterium]